MVSTKDSPEPVEPAHSRKPGDPYRCGLVPGDRLRLRKDLVIRDQGDRPTGTVHRQHEVWTVLPGGCTVQDDVWLERPDGKPHTWTDSSDIFEWFEKP